MSLCIGSLPHLSVSALQPCKIWNSLPLSRMYTSPDTFRHHLKTRQQQQQWPFYGPLSGTTRVSRYQKKHSPTHHRNHHPIFISFFHLQWSIASSLFKLRAWQSSFSRLTIWISNPLLTPSFLCRRFGFCWPLCAIINPFAYLLIYVVLGQCQYQCQRHSMTLTLTLTSCCSEMMRMLPRVFDTIFYRLDAVPINQSINQSEPICNALISPSKKPPRQTGSTAKWPLVS